MQTINHNEVDAKIYRKSVEYNLARNRGGRHFSAGNDIKENNYGYLNGYYTRKNKTLSEIE